MSTEKFMAVIQGLCKLYKLDAKAVMEGKPLEMGGVTFCLFHHGESDSPLLMAYCDFGSVPKELETQVYKQLLEANLSAYSGQGESFCLSPEGRVVYVNNYPLDTLTSELLAGYLATTAIFAKNWRKGFQHSDSDRSKKDGWRDGRVVN